MNCPYCNNPVPPNVNTCPSCGAQVDMQQQTQQQTQQPAVSTKKRSTYKILAFLLGSLGIHNFYAGRNSIAIVQLAITLGSVFLDVASNIVPTLVWIWAIVEIFIVKKDGKGLPMA